MGVIVKRVCVETAGTYAYPERMVRATLRRFTDSGSEDVDVWTRHAPFELALGTALVFGLDVAVGTKDVGDIKIVGRVDVRSPAAATKQRPRGGAPAPASPSDCGKIMVRGYVDQINFENKGKFIGEEIVGAAFVVVSEQRMQMFADDLGHLAALLSALASQREVFISYDEQGNVKIVRQIALDPV